MLGILVCEKCAENDPPRARAGVYRDAVGQVLCESCSEDREPPTTADYGRPVETGPRDYRRPSRYREGRD